LAAALVVVLVAGCSYTTGATNIAKQPDGSYSAQLNFVVSCGSGEHCSWYVHYRMVGTGTWTNVPTTPHGPVAGPVSNFPGSENVTGLMAGAEYEYQVCLNSQPGHPFVCVGPDDADNTTTKFTAAAWSLQTTPNHLPPNGALTATSCWSATACTAVGYYSNYINTNGAPVALAEHWDGSAWAVQTVATPSGAASTSLSGVSCTSATACTAVGNEHIFGTSVPLTERWDGNSWTIQTTPNPTGASSSRLSAVSCTMATACTAVGNYQTGASTGTLAERWDGTSWTIQTIPNPSGGGLLNGVSCTSATACTAVGSTGFCGFSCPAGTLAEAWDGRTWTIQTTPNGGGSLNAVSCTSATACTAVGYGNGGTLAERWDGSTWTIQSTSNGSGSLNAVSCTSATACTAVDGGTLAERWDGTSWTIQATATLTFGGLNGASCTSATACTAVGSGNGGTLAERWDGTSWTIQTTPTPGGGASLTEAPLVGVSCTSATACTAVGLGDGGTLAERWDGTSWRIQTTPNPSGGALNALNGVSCASAAACTAVGQYETEFDTRLSLAEAWNGSTWTTKTIPTPGNGSAESSLLGVSCTTATACTAVGNWYYNTGTSTQFMPLAERWDGSTWTIQSTPNGGDSLNAVSCTSATACTAVGSGNGGTLAERWDGSTWTIQTTPNVSGGDLEGVSCTSATACTAVGAGSGGTLAERWDGTSWTIQTIPNPSGGGLLNGVSCASAAACTAVGRSSPSTGTGGTLAERWDGTSWTIENAPNPSGATSSTLSGVSCTTATACTAVGNWYYNPGTSPQFMPLAERYSA
jgi:hypothetical protein